MKATKKTVKTVKTVKTAARKSNLSKTQISQIARFAAYKAHCHKSFQADRTPAERKSQVATYNSELRKAPAFIRDRFEPISARA